MEKVPEAKQMRAGEKKRLRRENETKWNGFGFLILAMGAFIQRAMPWQRTKRDWEATKERRKKKRCLDLKGGAANANALTTQQCIYYFLLFNWKLAGVLAKQSKGVTYYYPLVPTHISSFVPCCYFYSLK